ncbi:MAG: ACT domain-containing protein [Oscillospiraceae bacterium]|nr:ACT domain-containing protein [Oscillospiraceae bacterium]
MDNLSCSSQMIVIDSRVIPEVFIKVLEVKKTMANRGAKSLAEACRKSGISRSAYYKYKDHVFFYDEKFTQKLITMSSVLQDRPGVLANVLSVIHSSDANVMTLNQCIPTDGVATITITLKLNSDRYTEDDIRTLISAVDGVVDVRILNRE